jgi:hypothetical protein
MLSGVNMAKNLLTTPHRPAHGLCPINGIRDLVHWRSGRDWSNEFVFGLGQGGGFAYLRFNFADPPRQVYWGTASPRQHKYLAELFAADYAELENRSFKYSWNKARQAVESGTPPIIGPLDMFFLPFYPGIYHRRHIPIHYLLLVGYDDNHAYVHDTDQINVQTIPLNELELAWNVNIPGLGKRNRLAVLNIPQDIASTETLIRRSISDECNMMLHPPVSMLGIPAMQKVSREIPNWSWELGKDVARKCLQQVREYLNSPPDLLGNHLTAGRDIYITFLEQAAEMMQLDFSEATSQFKSAMLLIPKIAEAIRQDDLVGIASGFSNIAEIEKQAFSLLFKSVS